MRQERKALCDVHRILATHPPEVAHLEVRRTQWRKLVERMNAVAVGSRAGGTHSLMRLAASASLAWGRRPNRIAS